jgi:hypothetical protein
MHDDAAAARITVEEARREKAKALAAPRRM